MKLTGLQTHLISYYDKHRAQQFLAYLSSEHAVKLTVYKIMFQSLAMLAVFPCNYKLRTKMKSPSFYYRILHCPLSSNHSQMLLVWLIKILNA